MTFLQKKLNLSFIDTIDFSLEVLQAPPTMNRTTISNLNPVGELLCRPKLPSLSSWSGSPRKTTRMQSKDGGSLATVGIKSDQEVYGNTTSDRVKEVMNRANLYYSLKLLFDPTAQHARYGVT